MTPFIVASVLAVGTAGVDEAAAAQRPTAVRVVITDVAGTHVQQARVGQVLRFAAMPPLGRVCLDRSGTPLCASPRTPHSLIREVRGSLVVNGRITIRIVDFGRTLAVRSIPATR